MKLSQTKKDKKIDFTSALSSHGYSPLATKLRKHIAVAKLYSITLLIVKKKNSLLPILLV